MKKGLVGVVAVLIALILAAVWRARRDAGAVYFTGFVEGEERVIRSEAAGRVLEVPFAEGAVVPPDAVVARLDESDIAAKIAAKQRELEVMRADIETQIRRIGLVESTWKTGVDARGAEVTQAASALTLAERTYAREAELARSGASTGQMTDEARARLDQARAALARAKDLLAQAEGEGRNIAVNQGQLAMLRGRAVLAEAQLAELEVARAKHQVRSPGVSTVVQTQFVWPGELAQPGTPVVAVLDPEDKYVQVYLPVAAMQDVRVGSRVEIELDSTPGRRIPGEISFIADQASFTPEKIETRGDRVGQVYRAKVRVLADAARLKPGTEGNVYLVPAAGGADPGEPRAGSR
ncbi:MAG: HlyD family efflux transporter periplasmic adaptor subunit [Deltaproteobacteria bacterium]|nr:HlyD family efflux transporter periplasmic adaptor subunit [Deltaproteobacteria bacterium]